MKLEVAKDQLMIIIDSMNSKQAEIQKMPGKEGKSSGENSHLDPFRKSKIKQSEIVLGEVCCSRHLHCMHIQQHICSSQQNNSFSINSSLLGDFSPVNLSAEPLIQYQLKPEVDMLAQINIKKKQYQDILQRCEKDVQIEQKEKRLKQIQLQSKKALQKSKKIAYSPKSKWGHSIFAQEKKEKANEEQKQKSLNIDTTKRQIPMKPITQRITEYKQQQKQKQQQQVIKYNRTHKQVNTKETQTKIESNAAKILEEIRLQKLKKDEQKKIIEAKIRALQLKSLERVKNSKKKPLEGGQEFELGDSQYSTFSARANNRKLQKKKKKEKPKVPITNDEGKTGKNTHNFLKKSNKGFKKTTQKLKTQQITIKKEEIINENPQQQVKGPFFIWNIPVYQEQVKKVGESNEKVFMNIQRLNHKSGKTFREEANQYLTKKMEKKMAEQRQLAKKYNFMMEVEAKKQDLLRTYDMEQNRKTIDQIYWNEDEIFKPSTLENFHFYAKTSQT